MKGLVKHNLTKHQFDPLNFSNALGVNGGIQKDFGSTRMLLEREAQQRLHVIKEKPRGRQGKTNICSSPLVPQLQGLVPAG